MSGVDKRVPITIVSGFKSNGKSEAVRFFSFSVKLAADFSTGCKHSQKRFRFEDCRTYTGCTKN